MISEKEIFKSVLTIGTHPESQGGIASVLKIYKKYIIPFNYISTSKESGIFYVLFHFLKALLYFLLTMLFNRDIKIIHIHTASYASFHRKYLFFYLGKYWFNKKIVYHIHGAEFHLFHEKSSAIVKRKISHILTSVDIVICLSEEWKNYFDNTFQINKIVVINNVVDNHNFIRNYSNTEEDIINFLFMGFVGKRKGIWDILDIIIQNRDSLDKFKLYIGGNGDIGQLLTLIQKEKLNDLVSFVGWIKDSQKINLFKKCHVYLLPSYNEGLPISILEAMSFSLPIISTNVGGIPQVVKDKRNGLIVAPGNLNQLYSAIRFFIDFPKNIKVYGDYSAEIVKDYYIETVLIKLKNLYTDLLRD